MADYDSGEYAYAAVEEQVNPRLDEIILLLRNIERLLEQSK